MKHDDMDKYDVYFCVSCGEVEVTKKNVPPTPCYTCSRDKFVKTNLSRKRMRELHSQGDFDNIVKSYLTDEQIAEMYRIRLTIPQGGIGWKHEQPQTPPQSQEIFTPTCPTCHSPDIAKISSADRAGSIFLFGIFSSKINKQFECKNCGYKW